jgi:long-chain acyl-CoA synthetase
MERLWQTASARGGPTSISFDDVTLPEALARTATRFPDNPALIFQGTIVSYRELEDRVARFASALAGMGIRKGKKVSIVLGNMVQTVVAIYGTLRTGAIVVLHNPRNDEMQMGHQLKVAGSEMAICLDVLVPRMLNLRNRTQVKKIVSCHIRDYLPFLKKQLFPLVRKELHLKTPDETGVFEFTELVDSNKPLQGIHKSAMDETAFILFTSTTTGKSKGVELTHSNIIRNVQQLRACFPSFKDGQERVVGCLPFFHSFGLTCA